MIIKNYSVEIVDSDFRSDNILLFDFKNKSFFAKIFYKIFKLFGKPVTSKEFLVKNKLKDDDIVKYIYDQQSLLQHFAKRAPKYLLLGHDAMSELKLRTTYGSFMIGEDFAEGYVKNRFAGLKVILVPTMKGVLVLHDICESTNASEDSSLIRAVSNLEKI
jgi:hypothetical protein